jgi:hypothetical protein
MQAQVRPRNVTRNVANLLLAFVLSALFVPLAAGGLDCWAAGPSDQPALFAYDENLMLAGEARDWPARLGQWLPCAVQACGIADLAPMAGLVLGLSLLLIFNVGLWGHVRRVSASPRREWRGRR